MADDNDPVIASYELILSAPHQPISVDSTSSNPSIYVLQYSAHRPASRPYAASRQQKPSTLRCKPKTGLVEVDVPIITTEHYNNDAGSRYGSAMAESRTVGAGGSHGLVGGFNTGPAQVGSLHDIPAHQDQNPRPLLAKQTLGGKIAKPTEREPIYFLGSLHNGAIYLSHLDALVQLRPQLHHIDAEDENSQRRLQMSGGAPGTKKPGLEIAPKLESKAIELKLKDNKEDPRDRSLNVNAKLLRDIQIDSWQKHEWIDQDDTASVSQADSFLHQVNESEGCAVLKSALSNGDWLDRMSAPREDGKKGLLSKLRGRERERARRKKAEEERKKSKQNNQPHDPSSGPLIDQSSDSELSSPEASDLDMDAEHGHDVHVENLVDAPIEIKEEQAPEIVPPKKRGRPRKTQN